MRDVNALLMSLAIDREVRNDPYPIYKEFRALGAMVKAYNGFTVATGYESSTQVLRRSEFGKGLDRIEEMPENAPYFRERSVPPSMLFQDPPEHSRLRRSVSHFFTPRSMEKMRNSVTDIANSLFSDLKESKGGDLVARFALPLPVWMIGDILGVPKNDRFALQPYVSKVAKTLDFNLGQDELTIKEAEEASEYLIAYFRELLTEKVKTPGEDLLSEIVSAERDDEGGLTLDEACSMAILLFAAGFETTGNLIGNATYALSNNMEQYKALVGAEVDIKSAVDELIRYDSPVQLDGRVVLEDVTLFGVELSAGSFVVTLLGSANHDETIFSEPESLDLGRVAQPSMSFGQGIHFCLGSYLAKMELGVFLELLIGQGDFLSIESMRRKESLTLRGFEEMVVQL